MANPTETFIRILWMDTVLEQPREMAFSAWVFHSLLKEQGTSVFSLLLFLSLWTPPSPRLLRKCWSAPARE